MTTNTNDTTASPANRDDPVTVIVSGGSTQSTYGGVELPSRAQHGADVLKAASEAYQTDPEGVLWRHIRPNESLTVADEDQFMITRAW